MTIFKSSIFLTLLLSSCFSVSAELSSKQKNLLYCTGQTAGCVMSTAVAAVCTYLIARNVRDEGMKEFFYGKGTFLEIALPSMALGWTTCLYYLGYHMGKDARNSYRKAFSPKKESENAITPENMSEPKDSTTVANKNALKEMIS